MTKTVPLTCISPSTAGAHVWGAGFISADAKPNGLAKKIHAVRGPLSREIFIAEGVDCPEIYGDPAILLAKILPRKASNRYRFGIVPHYIDKGHPWIGDQLARFGAGGTFIDIEADIREVVDRITECEFIISSSLHGLICADTYGIPSTRISLGTGVLGGDFKFQDYRQGVGGIEHENHWPARDSLDLQMLSEASSLADITQSAEMLLSAFPIEGWNKNKLKTPAS